MVTRPLSTALYRKSDNDSEIPFGDLPFAFAVGTRCMTPRGESPFQLSSRPLYHGAKRGYVGEYPIGMDLVTELTWNFEGRGEAAFRRLAFQA